MKQITKFSEQTLIPEDLLADRIKNVPRSFIREILKVAISPDIISFAGGLPNRELFPADALKECAIKVFEKNGTDALQYSNSEGYLPLREYISQYYAGKHNIRVVPENILITCGSQQGLDLLGKVLINENDEVIIEEPGYLGAIQALSVYGSKFMPVRLNHRGMDIQELDRKLHTVNKIKMMYVVPEFQNPSGISYSPETRTAIIDLMRSIPAYIVEDNPYIDLRFQGKGSGSFYHRAPGKTILLGSFSKTIVPGFRIGWVVATDKLMEKLIVAKQATDLHTNIFSQMILFEYLSHCDHEKHIGKIIEAYGQQCRIMVRAIQEFFPSEVMITQPLGGMFLWATLPDHLSSMELFRRTINKKVAFVPGNPFYTDNKKYYPTFRLNFSCSGGSDIQEGIARIGSSLKELIMEV
jgi:2-aminoadipate transaminase